MSNNIDCVSFGRRMPIKKINTTKIIDSANKTAEDYILVQRPRVQQTETALRKSAEILSLKKVLKFVLDSITDPKA